LARAAIVSGELALLLEAAHPQTVELHSGDLREHLHQLVLDQLETHQRLAELGALLGIGRRRLVCPHSMAESAPGDGDPGGGEHPGGVLEAAGTGEHVPIRHPDRREGDVRLQDGAHRALARLLGVPHPTEDWGGRPHLAAVHRTHPPTSTTNRGSSRQVDHPLVLDDPAVDLVAEPGVGTRRTAGARCPGCTAPANDPLEQDVRP